VLASEKTDRTVKVRARSHGGWHHRPPRL